MAIQAGGLPFVGLGGITEHSNGAGSVGGGGSQTSILTSSHYQLPALDNLRTKSDLLAIDRIMEQAQATIYDRPAQMEAAGLAQVSQPGTYLMRSENKVKYDSSPTGALATPRIQLPPYNDESPPALTPSYPSNQSPVSLHSNISASPPSTAPTYPNLPGSSSEAMPSIYLLSNMAPTTLATQFHGDDHHCLRGAHLHRAQPVRTTKHVEEYPIENATKFHDEAMESSDDGTVIPTKPCVSTPLREKEDIPTSRHSRPLAVSELVIDSIISPGAAPSSVGSRSSTELDERNLSVNDVWLGVVRTIEDLRDWIRGRLDKGEYERDGSEDEQKDSKFKDKLEDTGYGRHRIPLGLGEVVVEG